MKKKGQVGRILTSIPALIYIFFIMLIFVLINLFLDKTVHRYLEIGKLDRPKKKINRRRKLDLMEQLDRAKKQGALSDVADIEQELKDLYRS